MRARPNQAVDNLRCWIRLLLGLLVQHHVGRVVQPLRLVCSPVLVGRVQKVNLRNTILALADDLPYPPAPPTLGALVLRVDVCGNED